LAAARAGSAEAMTRVLELCRGHLHPIADGELDPSVRASVSASDLVQDTLATARRDFAGFQGASADELRAWLREILLNKIATCKRHDRNAARAGLHPDGPTELTTPSRLMAQGQRAVVLKAALERLPADYRQVIAWRQMDNLSFGEIAARLERSLDDVRELWWRAIQRLQMELGDSL